MGCDQYKSRSFFFNQNKQKEKKKRKIQCIFPQYLDLYLSTIQVIGQDVYLLSKSDVKFFWRYIFVGFFILLLSPFWHISVACVN